MRLFFEPKREWDGETCFVLGGGPSALGHDLEKLRGHKLIVINSSCYVAPWADFLVFSDTRWWDDNVQKITKTPGFNFEGRIICVSTLARHPRLLHVRRRNPPGISLNEPTYFTIKYTTLIPALNLAAVLGARKIVMIGIDGKNGGKEGKTTHHHQATHPHRWKQTQNCFEKQRRDMGPVARDLAKLGIECVNASPGSALSDIWPIVDYEEMLKEDTVRVMSFREAAE